ncbi:hypothetical protein [Parvibaculum sp.]|jgi:hypothetical protein|uniref:hypothetical protein n=1 Tax=Parvibaculum sp. TaxID=2024848 RepID=UPI002FDB47CF
MSGKNLVLCFGLAAAIPLLGLGALPAAAQETDGEVAEEMAPATDGDIRYELSDPEDSPPVNYRSDYDEEYDTPELHDAEMYAEEYEKQREEERIRNKEQLDRINDFSSGAVTTDGVMGGSR